MNFHWKCQVPDKGWWANYRWHLTEPSEKLGLKSSEWKETLFRKGWQGKILEIEGFDNAKKCLQGLQNGTITAFGGRFCGASYNKNAERVIKQAKRSLKAAIKKSARGEDLKVEEIAVVPPSYYNWGIIIAISIIIIFVFGLALYLFLRKKYSNKQKK